MEGLQIWSSNGVQAHSLHGLSSFHRFTKTTFTDYFSHNTKHLLKIFFTLTTTEFIQTTNNISIKATVLFYAHRWGFIQRKSRKFLITIMVINTEAAIRGQTKDLSSLTSSPWQQLLSPLVPRFSISTLWSLTASVPSSAVPHNHLTSPFSFPLHTLFHRGPNTFVGSINMVLVWGKSVMNGENMKMLFRHKRCLPASPSDGDNVHCTTHDIWLGILKSFINHTCSKIMDFIIGSVT